MSFKEVTELRKAGRLDEAYKMAAADLSSEPENIWPKRAMAWVLYEWMKGESRDKNFDGFVRHMEEIVKLNLPGDETLFFEQLAWVLARFVIELPLGKPDACSRIFNAVRTIQFGPSGGFSYLLRAFHRHRGGWKDYIPFCDWWNFDHLQDQDYRYYKTEKGQKVMPLAEQVCIGYAQAVLSSGNMEKAENFLSRLSNLRRQHPEYQYPLYFESKILLMLGRKAEAFQLLLPFVRQKRNDFWVWQVLGDAAQDDDLAFSCYCKALTCKCKEEMLVGIKEKFARMLISRKLYREAKTEIEQVLQTRKANQWGVGCYLIEVQEEAWFNTIAPNTDNVSFYHSHAATAGKVLYSDLPVENILITNVNAGNSTANFVTLNGKEGYFRMEKNPSKTLSVGDKLTAQFVHFYPDKCCRVSNLVFDEAGDEHWHGRLKSVSGSIYLDAERRFGMVVKDKQSYYVPRQLLHGLNPGDPVNGMAVSSFDKKRNCPGWRFLNLRKQT